MRTVLFRTETKPIRAGGIQPDEMMINNDRIGCASLLHRVRGEFTEMPGMRLTTPQAARLWGLDLATAEQALSALVQAGFLARRGDGYARVSAT